METYMTIDELAGYLKLAEQTIRRWVLNREIPIKKKKKVIRYRNKKKKKWIDDGGYELPAKLPEADEGGLFENADQLDELAETEPAEEEAETESATQGGETEKKTGGPGWKRT
jgi:hypothetical protein